MTNAMVAWGLVATGVILLVAGALLHAPPNVAEHCLLVGLPLVPLGLVLMPSFRRRTSPLLGAFIGLLLGAYLGAMGGLMHGLAVMWCILGGTLRYLDQGAIFPMLESVVGLFIWAATGSIWCFHLWKRSHQPSPSVDSSTEASPVAEGEDAIHQDAVGRKDKRVAAILAIVFGWVGAHQFYLGNRQRGFIYILLGFFWVSPHLGLIDGITYLAKPDEVFQRNYMNWFCSDRQRKSSRQSPMGGTEG